MLATDDFTVKRSARAMPLNIMKKNVAATIYFKFCISLFTYMD
jgi:rRNA maturation endonuclease Nob1